MNQIQKSIYILLIISYQYLTADYLAKPYLSNPKTDGITIAWVLKANTDGTEVHFGETNEYGKRIGITKVDTSDWKRYKLSQVFIHKVQIRGLKPGNQYFYKVSGGGLPDYESHFYTISDSPDQEVLMAFGGDYGAAWPDLEDVEYVEKRVGRPIDFFFDTGDHAIGRRFRAEWQGRIPVILARGNHDNEDKYTSDVGGNGKPGQVQHYYDFDEDKLNFSFSWGPVFFVVNGSSIYKPIKPKTFKWVEEQYKHANKPWKIFGCHGVFFTDASHHQEGPARAKQMWPLFKKYGVQFQFNGHSHVYYRTHRIDENGDPDPEGTVSCTFGGTNQGKYWDRPLSKFAAFAYIVEERGNGIAYVHFTKDTAQLEFITRPRKGARKYELTDSFFLYLRKTADTPAGK